MNTSQNRSISSCRWPRRRRRSAKVSSQFRSRDCPRNRSVTRAIRSRAASGRCAYPSRRSPGRTNDARPRSSITGSESGSRRSAAALPIRATKRWYSVKQPSAMCWPLSGGGGGSPSRSGSVWTAPPSVGRASWRTTSWPRSTSSSAAASPASPPPTTATRCGREVTLPPHPGRPGSDPLHLGSQEAAGDDAELRRQREPRLAVEDVVAARLDPLERRAVEAGERADAGGAAAVQRAEQRQPLVEIRPRPRALVGHQRLPRRRHPPRGDVVLGDAVGGELVLREVDAAELPVLAHVAHHVDQLQGDAERLGGLRLVGPVDADAGDADGAGDVRAVVAQLVEGLVALSVEVDQAAVHQVV